MLIDVDLKAIQKGSAKDLTLEDNDIVAVMPKDKKEQHQQIKQPVSRLGVGLSPVCMASNCSLIQNPNAGVNPKAAPNKALQLTAR